MNDLMVIPAQNAARNQIALSPRRYPLRDYQCILRRPDDRTEICETGRPNYVIAWLREMQRASETTTYISLPVGASGFVGCGHPRLDSAAGYQIAGSYGVASTTVSLASLLRALFTRRDHLGHVFAPYSLLMPPEDMNAAYFTGTTLVLIAEPRIPETFELSETRSEEPSARVTAVGLAAFLQVSLQELGVICNIGRTTFTSWQTKNPRVSTVRDLYRVQAVVKSLRATIGDEKTRAWLSTGNPSPFELLACRDISTVENLASALLFPRVEHSPSMSISDFDMSELPKAKPSGKPLAGKTRAVRNRSTIDR